MFDAALTAPTFAEVYAAWPDAAVFGVDVPIGLPDEPPRAADVAARSFLARGSSVVFPTFPRAVYELAAYGDAREACRRSGWPVISAQSFALARRILELDAWQDDQRVVEVHPEVSFRELAGTPLAPKKTWNGAMERRRVLAGVGIELPEQLPEGAGVPVDDVLDAAVAAWSAQRYATGAAQPLPTGARRRVGTIWR